MNRCQRYSISLTVKTTECVTLRCQYCNHDGHKQQGPSSMKQSWRPGTMIYPLPAVLVSCGSTEQTRNLITVAWTGTICSDPAMCYISVQRPRYSHHILMEEMEFTINLTTERMARATDWCGVRSGREYDKWREMGLTPVKDRWWDAIISRSRLCR